MTQTKQPQWLEQWQIFRDDELFLFKDWIHPNTLEDFRSKSVLEAGCGGGQHTGFVAPYADHIVAVDLNSIEVAIERNSEFSNIDFVEADISEMNLGRTFDVVYSIGVIHHTDDPDKTVRNLVSHVKPGGKFIIWVYSKEGNWIAENIVERVRRVFVKGLSVRSKLKLSQFLTTFMYAPIYTIYLLPLRSLPYYEYFANFRKLSFRRNTLNVFDKLNAPQVVFIERRRVLSWFQYAHFTKLHLASYKGVSWQASGTLIDV
ncbi:MAG: class I SAM-dependent methyltransferase [Candidatus Hydrogenedentes bacterium]|nr:class I SAM-dependent methyltransferase [Candidatus Hydrogenedentota bacterium]